MPEGERRLVEFVVAEAPSATAEKPQRRPPAASTATREDAIERVFLPMEDPSEYRPELAPGGTLENLGKEVKNFRVYYEVGLCIKSCPAVQYSSQCVHEMRRSPTLYIQIMLLFLANSFQDGGERHEMVRKTYAEMHRYQTVEFGKEMVSLHTQYSSNMQLAS
jgi:hypothetical protein